MSQGFESPSLLHSPSCAKLAAWGPSHSYTLRVGSAEYLASASELDLGVVQETGLVE